MEYEYKLTGLIVSISMVVIYVISIPFLLKLFDWSKTLPMTRLKKLIYIIMMEGQI